MADVDGRKELGLRRTFNEYLVVEIVAVVGNKDVNIPHDLKYIQALSLTCITSASNHKHAKPALESD